MNLIAQNAMLVALFPLIASIVIFLGAAVDRKANKLAIGVSLTGTLLALVWSLGLLMLRLTRPDAMITGVQRWMTAGSLDLNLGWTVDNLSAMMLVVVCFISLLVQIYSIEYMAHDEGVPRYYGALSVFTSVIASSTGMMLPSLRIASTSTRRPSTEAWPVAM